MTAPSAQPQNEKRPRYALLDELRGLNLLSMIAYHTVWDLVWMFGMPWYWYLGRGAHLWQQGICWTFILLSGFCLPMGRRPVRRGAVVFGGGAVVTLATVLFMPSSAVWFGVLTLLGSAMLITGVLDRWLRRVPPLPGLAVSGLLFVLTRSIDMGTVGLPGWRWHLPAELYRNYVTAYLGFPQAGFFSTDYFPLMPWLFLFWCGYYLFFLVGRERLRPLCRSLCPPLGWVGRHSLLIYMLHQPVAYGVLSLWFALR